MVKKVYWASNRIITLIKDFNCQIKLFAKLVSI